MCTKIPVWTLSFGLFLAVAPFSLSAQQGTLAGTVTDVLTLAPVPGAEIQILGGGETRTVVANNQGQYTVGLPAGTYDLAVRVLSYRDERFSNVRRTSPRWSRRRRSGSPPSPPRSTARRRSRGRRAGCTLSWRPRG